MTIEIRAKVQRHPKIGGTPLGEPWLALVYTLDPEPTEENYNDTYETTWCGSLPEAIQAVALMRKNIERALMDEAHASRASRREEKPCTICNGMTSDSYNRRCKCGASLFAHHAHHPHPQAALTDHCSGYVEADPHTMEATA